MSTGLGDLEHGSVSFELKKKKIENERGHTIY
jgi:hypothetical protein